MPKISFARACAHPCVMGLALAIAPVACAFAVPAAAQESSYRPDAYWDVAGIEIDDGYFETYADYLAGQWKMSQEFAKKKGWIDEYHVLMNANKRKGEPDVYLVTKFKVMPDAAEQLRRQKAYEEMMKKDARKMDTESGERAKYRHLASDWLLQEAVLK